jgi:hypothetical protein
LFYLPSYSLELNPEELLNADLKHAVSVRTRAKLRAVATQNMTEIERLPSASWPSSKTQKCTMPRKYLFEPDQ